MAAINIFAIKISCFCVQQRKESHTGLEELDSERKMTISTFGWTATLIQCVLGDDNKTLIAFVLIDGFSFCAVQFYSSSVTCVSALISMIFLMHNQKFKRQFFSLTVSAVRDHSRRSPDRCIIVPRHTSALTDVRVLRNIPSGTPWSPSHWRRISPPVWRRADRADRRRGDPNAAGRSKGNTRHMRYDHRLSVNLYESDEIWGGSDLYRVFALCFTTSAQEILQIWLQLTLLLLLSVFVWGQQRQSSGGNENLKRTEAEQVVTSQQ